MDVAYAASAVLALGVLHNAIDKRSYGKVCAPKPPVEQKQKYSNMKAFQGLEGVPRSQIKSVDQVENTLADGEKFRITLRGGQQFFIYGRGQLEQWLDQC